MPRKKAATPVAARPIVIQLDEERLKQVISSAVEEAFIRIGLDTASPVELQKDMAYLRSWRLLVQSTGKRTWFAALGIVLAVVLSAFAVGIGVPAKFLGIVAAARTP